MAVNELNNTPNALRLHIAIFGRRNSGKSSLIVECLYKRCAAVLNGAMERAGQMDGIVGVPGIVGFAGMDGIAGFVVAGAVAPPTLTMGLILSRVFPLMPGTLAKSSTD